jgi:hypothetical protein
MVNEGRGAAPSGRRIRGMAGTDGAAGGTGTVWVDDREVDPSWPPPPDDAGSTAAGSTAGGSTPPGPDAVETPTEPTGRSRQRRLATIGGPVLLLVMIIIAVVAAGGFEVRTDGPVPIEPGQEFATGPYVYTFDRATVQNAEGYGDYPRIEEVIVYGTARNTFTEALIPYQDEFLGRSADGRVIESRLTRIESESFSGPDKLTPGVRAQPIKVTLEFPPKSEFSDTFRFGARDLVYENDSVFTSSDQKTWSPDGRRIYRLDLPLERLPKEEDW